MNEDDLPESLVQDEEEGGFVDLDLRLVRLDVRPNGTFFAEGRGRYNSCTLWICPRTRCRVEDDAHW